MGRLQASFHRLLKAFLLSSLLQCRATKQQMNLVEFTMRVQLSFIIALRVVTGSFDLQKREAFWFQFPNKATYLNFSINCFFI
jgi:hypothetical protein